MLTAPTSNGTVQLPNEESRLQIQEPQAETQPLQPLYGENQSSFWHHVKKHKMKAAAVLSVANGALFYTIAEAGIKNIVQILNITGQGTDIAMSVVGAGSSLCYTMFCILSILAGNLYNLTYP